MVFGHLVSSICMIWVFPIHSTSIKKHTRNQPWYFYGMAFWSLMEKRTRNLVQSVLSSGFQGKRTIKYFGKFHQKFMEVILLCKNKNIFLVCQYFKISSLRNGATMLTKWAAFLTGILVGIQKVFCCDLLLLDATNINIL